VTATRPALASDAGFTLDSDELARQRAANARRLHTLQIPAVRAVGFAILCVIAVMQDLRLGVRLDSPWLATLLATDVAYAALSWVALRAF